VTSQSLALRTLNHTSASYVALLFFWSPGLHCDLLHSYLSNASDHLYQITVELRFLFTCSGHFVLGLPGSHISSTLSQQPQWNSLFVRSLEMACPPQSYIYMCIGREFLHIAVTVHCTSLFDTQACAHTHTHAPTRSLRLARMILHNLNRCP